MMREHPITTLGTAYRIGYNDGRAFKKHRVILLMVAWFFAGLMIGRAISPSDSDVCSGTLMTSERCIQTVEDNL